MRKSRNCTFLHSGRDSQSLRKNNQITSVLRLKSLLRSSTTVIETHGSVESYLVSTSAKSATLR